ncbi:asparagine synthase (glutamine-hydrolyzing) [Methanococcus maripaludis C5]|uniref:Putative asparagine synthetase [glutamine-hydrolyzing] n=1 Tax=Methanococcus maripaludis (strain C5 / ATCC BAA-1333) TaxID=402880 RepID=A4FX82_METM5|nr:asparagine synthase (glutamine-hydrolyzing) [Methanococcus maripaludis]ABO34811.1 asparagine synthase (glutamine-hydrolyzing) [Methanococcus maripaludis C5]
MCGINGFNFSSENYIKLMNNEIKHRGPDDRGFFLDNEQKVSLGHVRLSILDLTEKGHQPMFYSKETASCNENFENELIQKCNVAICYNGEIYNYQELKDELIQKGYNFNTNSDTEVLLASYLEWGLECVNKFNGMWAFCIYDKEKNILFLSRDRLGVKPVYYYFDENYFIFSSELKGILKHDYLNLRSLKNINKDAIDLYFSLGYIPSPYSIYNNVYKIESASNLVFDIHKKEINIQKYWELPDYSPNNDKKKLLEVGKKLLEDSVKLRMRSDVPVGAFLSGGIDSSTVVGIMKNFTNLEKLHTFSIGFEGDYDETPYINMVKDDFKTIHHHEYFKENDFENIVDIFSEIYDEPFGDYSGFPTYFLSNMAKKTVIVSLSGDGGDEVFGGYNMHLAAKRLEIIRKLPKILRRIGSKIPVKENLNGFFNIYSLKKAFEVSLSDPELFFINSFSDNRLITEKYYGWTMEKLKYSLKKGGNDLVEGFRIYDLLYNTLSDNFLVKVDRASMRNSLEVRSPFLDYRFAEFAQKIPSKWKVDLFNTKKLMKELVKGVLPLKIITRKKQGFTPPIEKWILDKKYEKDFEKGLLILKDINPDIHDYYIEKVMNRNDKLSTHAKIRLFIFSKWWEKWMEY